MIQPRATRGTGLLEGFLARRRALMAGRLLPPAPRDGCVVDIGCGSHPLFLLSAPFRRNIGLDRVTSPAMVEALRTQGVEMIHHDLEADAALPLADCSADAVTMLAVIEHIPPERRARLLQDARRVLKPGGRVVLTTPAAWTVFILQFLSRTGFVSHEEIEEHHELLSGRGLRRLLEGAGFGRVRRGSFEAGLNLWATWERMEDAPGT